MARRTERHPDEQAEQAEREADRPSGAQADGQEDGRFSRHELIPGWSQHALRDATVVVLGVGALGNEVARLLAMAGLGRLVLCDPDVVEVSNLSRCVLFRPSDVGWPKVTAAKEGLAELAPTTFVDARCSALHCGVGLAELRDAALVVGCLDSVSARVELAGRCALAGVGWLDGGTSPWGGEVRRFLPGGPCYGCVVGSSGRAALDDPVGCGVLVPPTAAAASAPVSALIGSWLATSAIRTLCGLPDGPPITVLDLDGARHREVGIRRADDCPLHEPIPGEAVTRIELSRTATVEQVLTWVDAGEQVLTWSGFEAGHPAPTPGRLPGRVGQTCTVLSHAPPTTMLRDLGVAPREILPVVSRRGVGAERYIELSAEPAERQAER